MRWSEYYQKMDDWAVSTAVSRFSSVEDMGTSNEVVDVLYTIVFKDKKVATRIIKKALQHALDCLIQAQQALYDSGNVSFIDMVAKKKFTSIWKYASLTDADIEVERASDALADLSLELRILREKDKQSNNAGREYQEKTAEYVLKENLSSKWRKNGLD